MADCPSASCCASFYRGQPVRILANGKYHAATFVETDCCGVATVRTEDGRLEQVWDCNIYDAPAQLKECAKCGVSAKWSSADCPICFGDLIQHNSGIK